VREDAEKPASSLPPDPLSARIPIDIVLLMNEPEAAFQAAAFSRIDTSLSLAHASTLEMLDQALPKLSPRARLIGFSTSLIAPASALEAFSNGAYNFHPGPPSYPGNRPSAFACYAGEQEYGVTFHRMVPRVDEGEILDYEIFSIANCNTSHAIAILAYQRLARLFLMNATALAQLDRDIPGNGMRWSGQKTTQAQYNAMRAVPGNVDPVELDRRIRAFNWIYTPISNPGPARLAGRKTAP
jgi:methionyl-tRNA formyltransferase